MRGHGVDSMSQCQNTVRDSKLYFMTLAQYCYMYQQNNIVYIHKNRFLMCMALIMGTF